MPIIGNKCLESPAHAATKLLRLIQNKFKTV